MEKALTKVGSLKVGSSWISKKAKEEFTNISEDITVSIYFSVIVCKSCVCFPFCVLSFFLIFLYTFALSLIISAFGDGLGHGFCVMWPDWIDPIS